MNWSIIPYFETPFNLKMNDRTFLEIDSSKLYNIKSQIQNSNLGEWCIPPDNISVFHQGIRYQ